MILDPVECIREATVLCNFFETLLAEGAFKNVILVGVFSMKGKVWVNPAGKNPALVAVFSVGLVRYEHFWRMFFLGAWSS